MRLDILLFLGYDLDKELPWHNTISRTRQLYGEKIFLEAFQKVLGQCITSGMVSGNTQAIDSAFVKANASMDSLKLKVPAESLEEHLHKIRHISEEDKHKPRRPAKGIKSYIPPHGTYKGGPDNFKYIVAEDVWLCRNGIKATYRKTKTPANGTLQKLYYTKRSQCKNCPFKTECIGKSHEKRIAITAYKAE